MPVKFEYGIGRRNVEHDKLVGLCLLDYGVHLAGDKPQLVCACAFNLLRDRIIAENAQLWMRNRNEPYLFRDVYPNFSHFLFCSNDTEYSDIEIEAFFRGHHFYQGTGFSVLVFFHCAGSVGC